MNQCFHFSILTAMTIHTGALTGCKCDFLIAQVCKHKSFFGAERMFCLFLCYKMCVGRLREQKRSNPLTINLLIGTEQLVRTPWLFNGKHFDKIRIIACVHLPLSFFYILVQRDVWSLHCALSANGKAQIININVSASLTVLHNLSVMAPGSIMQIAHRHTDS